MTVISINTPEETYLGTSISGWGRSVLLALNNLDFDGASIFRDCGLDPEAQGKALVRNPVAKMQYVWKTAETNVSDHSLLATEIARHLNASSFYALGFGIYASASIEDMLLRFSRFRAILSSSVDFIIEHNTREVTFQITDHRPVQSHLTAVVFLLFLLRICRELGGSAALPARLDVPWMEDHYGDAIKQVVDGAVNYGSKSFILYFDRETVERPLPSANVELASFQDRLCRDYLASLDEHAHLPSRVRAKIAQGLANGRATVEGVAQSLHMSCRSLQRKLMTEETSFRAILNEVRRELATTYIKNPDLSATEISYMLGFSGLAQFTTVFHNWFGMTFSRYRKQILKV